MHLADSKTSFKTPFVFGNSVNVIQRFVDKVTSGLNFVFVYINDLLIDSILELYHFSQYFIRLKNKD